ncbi:mechanosensitive ion channel family protein [Aquimarina agarivorans]|uniref:mechanosensitive ion channel family protein n=1 Tax=Aquimarina agarivorans TaxID=980584 RepID=UPI000248E740|nr:mechanosensitive ion channel domain-containing protein [Aquimarina agarivorans]
MDMDALKSIDVSKFIGIATEYGLKIAQAILVLFIGLWIIKLLVKGIKKALNRTEIDESLKGFLLNLLTWALKALLVITVLGQLGVKTTSFVAIIGAAGLAVGLALQGSLANFAGGALILLFKPFKVGDLIEAQSAIGVVKEIQIFVTKIITPDNKEVIIPNGALSNGNITNFSSTGHLRVDLVVGISYSDDIEKAKTVIMDTLINDPKVLKTPSPTVAVGELGDSSVNINVRPHATVADYWDVYFNSLQNVKVALDKAGIEIPFPQRVNHTAK